MFWTAGEILADGPQDVGKRGGGRGLQVLGMQVSATVRPADLGRSVELDRSAELRFSVYRKLRPSPEDDVLDEVEHGIAVRLFRRTVRATDFPPDLVRNYGITTAWKRRAERSKLECKFRGARFKLTLSVRKYLCRV